MFDVNIQHILQPNMEIAIEYFEAGASYQSVDVVNKPNRKYAKRNQPTFAIRSRFSPSNPYTYTLKTEWVSALFLRIFGERGLQIMMPSFSRQSISHPRHPRETSAVVAVAV
jgi:hypothetical protein